LLGVLVGAVFVEFIPLYSGDVLSPVINLAQKLQLPVSDVDPTTPGVPSVVYGVILLIALITMPRGAAGLGQRIGGLTKHVYSRVSSSARRVTP
jgi:ABC-type branched-subunit amino acid transport system permease subunit